MAILLTDGQTNRRRADLESEADLLKNGGNTARFETGSGKMLWLFVVQVLVVVQGVGAWNYERCQRR